jgi:protein TonB
MTNGGTATAAGSRAVARRRVTVMHRHYGRSRIPRRRIPVFGGTGGSVSPAWHGQSDDGFWHPAVERSREAGVKWIAFGIALALHVVALLITLPELRTAPQPEKKHNYVVVRKYVPPPPRIERRKTVTKRLTRKVPLPDPTPQEPEPIREPEPEIEPPRLPDDFEILLGVPEAPPAVGTGSPLIAGVGDVTNPVRIKASYVKPVYPEMAQLARTEGQVILQAVIETDGAVSEAVVLRSKEPGLGFEASAIQAVTQWRYEPATQDGRPVAVYFTVVVDFTLF